jgi:hypothetical protein
MRSTCSVVGPSESWPVVCGAGFWPNIRPIADSGEPSWAEAVFATQSAAIKAAAVNPRIIGLAFGNNRQKDRCAGGCVA